LRKRCSELAEECKKLKDRKAALPGEISKAEDAVREAEKALDDAKKKKEQCKEGEIREAPEQTTAPKEYLCATPDTKVETKVSLSTDTAIAATKGFSDYLKAGLKVIEKTIGMIPGAKGIVKLVKIPADLGVEITKAMSESGFFKRAGLTWVTVKITIGPLHKYTLKFTDLEICKGGTWVPYDKKKCELVDGGMTSTELSKTWKGDELTELTGDTGPKFWDNLGAAIQALIESALTSPEQLDADQKGCE